MINNWCPICVQAFTPAPSDDDRGDPQTLCCSRACSEQLDDLPAPLRALLIASAAALLLLEVGAPGAGDVLRAGLRRARGVRPFRHAIGLRAAIAAAAPDAFTRRDWETIDRL